MGEAAVQPVETEHEFSARRSIALEREMGFLAVCVFSISSIGLAYSGLLPFSSFAGMFPGVSLVRAIAIGAALAMLLAYTFAVIGTVAPRYAADYVVGSRVVSPPLAFASSWTLVIFMAMAGGWIAASIGFSAIPMFIQTLAHVVYDKSLLGVMEWVSSPSGVIYLGTFAVIVTFLLLMGPSWLTHRILLVGAALSVAAWLLICGLLASAPVNAFQASWDRFMGAGNFLDHLVEARRLGGVYLDSRPVTVALGGLILSLGLFSGFYNPTYFAGEVKEPKKNLLLGSWVALGSSLLLLGTAAFLMQRMVTLEWLASESFLSNTGTFKGLAMPWLPLYVAVLHPSRLLIYFLGATWIFALLNLVHTFLYTGSRIMLAWGEDHLLPRSVVFIHPELHSPIIPVLLVSIVAEAGVVEAALNMGVSSGVNPLFFVTASQFIPVLGITLLPFMKRDWFLKTTGIARLKIGPLPLITLVGALTLIYLLGVMAALLFLPGYNHLDVATVITFCVIFASGLAWFYFRRKFMNRWGRDMDALLKRAPEE